MYVVFYPENVSKVSAKSVRVQQTKCNAVVYCWFFVLFLFCFFLHAIIIIISILHFSNQLDGSTGNLTSSSGELLRHFFLKPNKDHSMWNGL